MSFRRKSGLAAFALLSLAYPGMRGVDGPAVAAATPAASDRIAITVSGHGPDVILIPGLASSAHVWDATVAHLATTHRVHVVQVAGFAGTAIGGNASGPVLLPVEQAIHDYILANRLQGAAVIGHSIGGTLALKLAIDHPGDAGRLLIVDAFPYVGMMFGPQAKVAMIEPQAAILRDRVAGGSQEAYAAGEPAQMQALIRSDNDAARAAVAAAVASDHRVVAQAMYDDMILDLRPDIGRIVAPVTVLYPWDPAGRFPQARVDQLYANAFAPLPHGRVERIDGSRHFIMIDQPQLFLDKVDAFLAS